LSNYFNFPHDIVDKYEIAPGVINEDVVTFSPGKKYDYIVSLSTLEHVGWDEQPRDPQKIIKAVNHLKELLKDGGQMLVTMPFGYNPHVDELVRTRQTGCGDVRYLLRISATNRWREAKWEEVAGTLYGSPFPCANAIMVEGTPERIARCSLTGTCLTSTCSVCPLRARAGPSSNVAFDPTGHVLAGCLRCPHI
jgi:SAM-dependent methyltransferase